MRCAVYIGIAVTFLFYAIYTTMVVIWCTPDMGTSWTNFFANPSVQVRCRKSNDLSVFQNAFNIFSDFYILLLPLPLLRHLNLRAFAKLGVTLIFFVGLLACVASTSGIYYRMHTRDNNDFTWQIVPSQVAMVFEMNIGVVCSCMPSVAVLIRHWAKKYEWWESVCRSQSKTIALRDLDTLQYVVRRDDNTGQWHVVNTDRLRAQLQDQLTAPNASKTSWADPREVSVREESGNIIARPEPAVTAATSCAEEEPVQIQSSSVPERLEVSSSTGDGTVTTSDLSMVGETNRRLEESMSWRPYRYSEPRFSMEPRYSTHMV